MTEAELISRADFAKKFMDEPYVKEAFDILQRDIVEAFADCPNRDLEGMRVLQITLRNLRQLRGVFFGFIQKGEMLQKEVQALRDSKEKSAVSSVMSRFRQSF